MNTICLLDFIASNTKMARVGIVWNVDNAILHVLCIFSIGYNEDVNRLDGLLFGRNASHEHRIATCFRARKLKIRHGHPVYVLLRPKTLLGKS